MRTTYTVAAEPSITLAELCEALADNRLSAEREDGYYVVTKRDLTRYTRASSPEKSLLMLDPNLARRVMLAG
jgi:hypothetical protein